MKKNHILADERIDKLLLKLSLPAMLGMLTMALYNIVDTIFIGRGVGTLGIAGLAICFPMQMMVLGIGTTLGIGSASIISRAFGAKKFMKADATFANAMFSVIVLSIFITITSLIFINPIIKLFGASPEILPYAKEYLEIIVIGTTFFVFAITSNNIIRSEGHAKTAMGSMVISAILNIIFDPIFIFVFKMGIRGAAIATVLAQLITVIYHIYFYKSGKSILKMQKLQFNPNVQKEIFTIGMASFARQIATSILMIIFNNILVVFGGIYVAVYAIINRILRFVYMPIFGIAQGMQPIVGYNYGAERNNLAKKTIKHAILYSSIVALLGFGFLYFFARQLFTIFTTDVEVIEKGVQATRMIILILPLAGFQIMGSTVFQSLGKPLPALFLTLTRQIIILIPLVMILPKFLGINGVWVSIPISEFLSALLTLILFMGLIKKLNKQ
ncbi:MAG: MATE family efflux transporter [Candidatus Cloacimonetes bacterium]|nr:MATE family efflux transporter [Candidatus Cloacimonadota bacterium]